MPKLRRRVFDESWKLVLEKYFWEFLDFYFPHIAQLIEKAKGHQFLDQELQKIVPKSLSRKRRLDKLVRVYLQDAREIWLLIHLEVQTYTDAEFAGRMFSYHYRIFDKYQKPVASLAILADSSPGFRPNSFDLVAFGKTFVHFQFEVVKLLDWQGKEEILQTEKNPFAIVTLASLKAFEKNLQSRYQWKYLLTRLLYDKGYTAVDVFNLYYFLDGIMVLPENLEIQYNQEIAKLEEAKTMPYITTAERIGIQKGIQEGKQLGLQEGKMETARNMIREGMAISLIVKLTGLPEHAVRQLQEESRKENQ